MDPKMNIITSERVCVPELRMHDKCPHKSESAAALSSAVSVINGALAPLQSVMSAL